MTNIENTPSPEATYVYTPVTFQLSLAEVATPYRFLNWVAAVASQAFSADLTGFSAERVATIAALVDHGLVSERRVIGGEQDGRVTYRVTPLGEVALNQAWAEADQVIRAS
jgi:hypothetical protein